MLNIFQSFSIFFGILEKFQILLFKPRNFVKPGFTCYTWINVVSQAMGSKFLTLALVWFPRATFPWMNKASVTLTWYRTAWPIRLRNLQWIFRRPLKKLRSSLSTWARKRRSLIPWPGQLFSVPFLRPTVGYNGRIHPRPASGQIGSTPCARATLWKKVKLELNSCSYFRQPF